MCFGILTDGCAARFCKPVNKCELAGKKDGSDLTCPRMPLPGHRAGTTDTVLCPSSEPAAFETLWRLRAYKQITSLRMGEVEVQRPSPTFLDSKLWVVMFTCHP